MSLVSCLPALETVKLHLRGPLTPSNLRCLLEALAWCPRLGALTLDTTFLGSARHGEIAEGDEARWRPDLSAFAQMRGLTKLAFLGCEADPCTVADVVEALVPLTGLAELKISLNGQPADVPAALGQLKGLRSLEFCDLYSCILDAGCLDLPKLMSLAIKECRFEHAEVLPCVTALQSLTRIELMGYQGPPFSDHQSVQLLLLQHITFAASEQQNSGACPRLSRPPADMGSLSSMLLHLNFSGQGLTQFPLVLTQLVALEHLNAEGHEFAELPAAITALSRLTELALGRCFSLQQHDQSQQRANRRLDVRTLEDLSAFSALCRLTFSFCEVMLCDSMLGVVRHASLASISFVDSHPAPECAPMILQLSQALMRMG